MNVFTEAEAAKKICHQSLAASLETFEKCIGSRCMAWQFVSTSPKLLYARSEHYSPDEYDRISRVPFHDVATPTEPDPRPKHVPPSYTWNPKERAWVEPEEEQRARTKGYCGLAVRGGPGRD
jgi:hypothetical protein